VIRPVAAVLVLATPAGAAAQAYRCPVPAGALPVRPDGPSADQPRRLRATGGYTLAVSWSPNHCRTRGTDASARFQCRDGRFGWVLHGLWPDGTGPEWPQYCRPAALLPPAVIRAGLCATPSAQLMQHEWAKHGTCMAGETPASYFRRSGTLYGRLRWPDMDALSRRPLTAGALAAAVARANPGLGADGLRVTADRQGWLDELWICLNTAFRYRGCPAHQGGLASTARLRVWRGPR